MKGIPRFCTVLVALLPCLMASSGDRNALRFGGLGNRNRLQGPGEEVLRGAKQVAILWDSTGIDRELQHDLLHATQLAFKNLNDGNLIHAHHIDVGTLKSSSSRLVASVKLILKSEISIVVSLLDPETLDAFTYVYEELSKHHSSTHLKIVSPRLVKKSSTMVKSSTLCLQMNELAMATALLNRVEKVGIKALLVVMDQDSSAQMELLSFFMHAAEQRMNPIAIAPPIVIVPGETNADLAAILNDEGGSRQEHGILLLATEGSQAVMELANRSKNYFLMRWFSPYALEYEQWAMKSSLEPNRYFNSSYGVYSVQYVGGIGWDNPTRRKTLRELQHNSEPSPRIVSSILAYDAAWMAIKKAKRELVLPMQGLSGEINFNADGYRRNGYYFGMSAVPESVTNDVALLQPSKWILEDILYLVETLEGQHLITEYNVATSSMLTKEELTRFAALTSNTSDCKGHSMEIRAHDPFNQLPTLYLFNKENLPNHILIPNQHGYGITFLCQHDEKTETTLKLACIPGGRYSDPVTCFRSHLKARQRRHTSTYTYRAYQDNPSYSNNPVYYSASNYYDPKSQHFSNRDDSYSNNYYQYGPPNGGGYADVTPDPMSTRFDTPIVSDDATPTTPGPAPKVPELRQVLKAAKPFVGSCVGAATGCAMCVLVLGRLPLGTNPPACTGPCFVGVFGSCGALLGRAFSETTVICTELFRQGYLDIDTFLADAEFGKDLMETSPATLKGYQTLAQPLVDKMKSSAQLSQLVAKFAVPWARYMKYTMGYSEEFDWSGYIITLIGTPICFVTGHVVNLFEKYDSFQIFPSLSTNLTALLTLLLVGLLGRNKLFRNNKILKP